MNAVMFSHKVKQALKSRNSRFADFDRELVETIIAGLEEYACYPHSEFSDPALMADYLIAHLCWTYSFFSATDRIQNGAVIVALAPDGELLVCEPLD